MENRDSQRELLKVLKRTILPKRVLKIIRNLERNYT